MRYTVAIRFRGEHVQRVDDKCRLSIPASYRQALELHGDQRLVMVRSLTGGCVQVFPVQAWAAYEDKVLALPQSDPTVIRVQRFQMASSHTADPDGHGRVVLPPSLRAYAGVGPSSEVVIAGHIDKFEIWERGRWDVELAKIADDLPQWSADLVRLGL